MNEPLGQSLLEKTQASISCLRGRNLWVFIRPAAPLTPFLQMAIGGRSWANTKRVTNPRGLSWPLGLGQCADTFPVSPLNEETVNLSSTFLFPHLCTAFCPPSTIAVFQGDTPQMESVYSRGLISVDQDRIMPSVALQGTSAKCHLIHYVLSPSLPLPLPFPLPLSLLKNNYCTGSFKQTFRFTIQ